MNNRSRTSLPPVRDTGSYAWTQIRLEYITSKVTLSEFAQRPGYPALRSLKRHSSKEDWPGQRAAYQRHVLEQAHNNLVQEGTELLSEHLRIARWLRVICGKLLERYLANMVKNLGTVEGEPNFDKLTPSFLKDWELSLTTLLDMTLQGLKLEREVIKLGNHIDDLLIQDLKRILEVIAHHVDRETMAKIIRDIEAFEPSYTRHARSIS